MNRLPVLLVGGVACSIALAQSAPSRGRNVNEERPSFEKLDKDHDGRISQDEARANTVVIAGFATADKNGDGHLSRAEFLAQFSRDD